MVLSSCLHRNPQKPPDTTITSTTTTAAIEKKKHSPESCIKQHGTERGERKQSWRSRGGSLKLELCGARDPNMKAKTGTVVFLLFVIAVMQTAGLDVCSSCHANATCDDKLDGSGKVCNCKYGFVGNGRTFCQDKDECQIGSVKICGQHTTCHNTYGSYYCTCLVGYRPSNNMATFIPNDGTNCQDIDECQISGICGEGAVCKNLEGRFDCRCQIGYKVHGGAEPFHPHKDKATCKVVDCGAPLLPGDAVLVSVTKHTFGGVAKFKCDQGFIWRRGDNASVCEASGRWTAPSIDCEEVDCGPPPVRLYSQMLWDGRSKLGTEVVYRCDFGYRNVERRDVFYCNATGQWDVPPVLCQEILCGTLPVVDNTVHVWDGKFTLGSTVEYYCKYGFYDNGGHNSSVCIENGKWTQPTLSCKEILCGKPPLLPHTGQMWNSSSTPGSTVAYFCNSGFLYLSGSNLSICTINGYWTTATILCKEINCGLPHLVLNSKMLWDGHSTFGSSVVYQCNIGYQSFGNNSVSLCLENGQWEKPAVVCKEIHCGSPVNKAFAKTLWDGTGRVGSVVYYECNEGYYAHSVRNVSVCEDNGVWEDIELICEEIRCGLPLTVPNTNLRWDGSTNLGSVVWYECGSGFYPEREMSACSKTGQWGQVSLICKEVVWQNRSVVLHRCETGYHSWRGTNTSICDSSTGLWRHATITCIEIKPPINHFHVLNERCLHWKAEKYEEATEDYKIIFTGSRDYQTSFLDKRRHILSSKADHVKVCLNLLPITNYSISVTAKSAKFTVTAFTNTSLTVPPAPVVHYREFDTPVPTLTLQRSPSTLDPISIYQIFVLPVDGLMVFDCSSPQLSTDQYHTHYITAEVHMKNIGTEMSFTVGDGRFYQGFLNTPLENGRDYYIILRSVSEWGKESKSLCVLWAKVKGSSYVLTVSSLSGAAVVGLIALAFLGGYSYFGLFKKL
ncbi:sushi domain-containing protein 1 isoform X2 [Boleophthalmus pectinirostris]|uniref:sushi domain-containing protein 1 isoform X2 n=1 Tax=Boleophthalmus pectinirostris TaxID=150288 RepID=UPI00242CDC3E|nr:sushi domain-containing protein 1 isoform X2 [Boleophthalmus pectinirostris]